MQSASGGKEGFYGRRRRWVVLVTRGLGRGGAERDLLYTAAFYMGTIGEGRRKRYKVRSHELPLGPSQNGKRLHSDIGHWRCAG